LNLGHKLQLGRNEDKESQCNYSEIVTLERNEGSEQLRRNEDKESQCNYSEIVTLECNEGSEHNDSEIAPIERNNGNESHCDNDSDIALA
jgi:hypothetical protein